MKKIILPILLISNLINCNIYFDKFIDFSKEQANNLSNLNFDKFNKDFILKAKDKILSTDKFALAGIALGSFGTLSLASNAFSRTVTKKAITDRERKKYRSITINNLVFATILGSVTGALIKQTYFK
jgi:hypothetical protein